MEPKRILSIDIFRGLTIFLMVFVNELAAVANIPAWMKHVPTEVNGMSFVDVVFPAFLFIVGMSIPFAVENRLSRNKSFLSFWKHVLLRTGGLLILGIYMVNGEEMNVEANPVPKRLWSFLLYIAAILIWNIYPKDTAIQRRRNLFLRIIGAGILLLLFFLFNKGPNDALIGMTPSWWGILGLIGWAYLISMLAYLPNRNQFWNFVWVFLGLALLPIFLKLGFLDQLPFSSFLKGQAGYLVHSLLVMGGVLCSGILRTVNLRGKEGRQIACMLLGGAIACCLGYLLEPIGGISKNKATLSWAFYSMASCFIVFALVFWLVDIKGQHSWANFLKPAGTNPLLTYILPAIVYAIIGYDSIPAEWNIGVAGIIRSLIFSIFILYLASRLTKMNIRLQL